jgi:hypothetical protein
MNVAWLKKKLADVPDNCEVILIVESFDDALSGPAFKVIAPGTGAEDGKVEIYGKG